MKVSLFKQSYRYTAQLKWMPLYYVQGNVPYILESNPHYFLPIS